MNKLNQRLDELQKVNSQWSSGYYFNPKTGEADKGNSIKKYLGRFVRWIYRNTMFSNQDRASDIKSIAHHQLTSLSSAFYKQASELQSSLVGRLSIEHTHESIHLQSYLSHYLHKITASSTSSFP